MLTLKIYVGVFIGIFKARMLKLGIHMDNVVVAVALLFYVHGKHLRSCRDGQLT